MLRYRVVYDAASYVPTGDLAACGVGVVVGLGGIALARALRRHPNLLFRIVTLATGVLGALVAFGFGLRSWGGIASARDLGARVASGRTKVAEGVVQNLRETGGHGSLEEFDVGAVTFRYGGDSPNAALHLRSYEGGPIQAGRHVRISYVVSTTYAPPRTDIARVEIDDAP